MRLGDAVPGRWRPVPPGASSTKPYSASVRRWNEALAGIAERLAGLGGRIGPPARAARAGDPDRMGEGGSPGRRPARRVAGSRSTVSPCRAAWAAGDDWGRPRRRSSASLASSATWSRAQMAMWSGCMVAPSQRLFRVYISKESLSSGRAYDCCRAPADRRRSPARQRRRSPPVAREIDAACRMSGSSASPATACPPGTSPNWIPSPAQFFTQPDDVKARIAMVHGGAAWRGWFPLDGELTSGASGPQRGHLLRHRGRSRAAAPRGQPVPRRAPGPAGRSARLDRAHDGLGVTLLGAIAIGLGLEADWFDRNVTADPTVLFRIFRYPPGIDEDGASASTPTTGC